MNEQKTKEEISLLIDDYDRRINAMGDELDRHLTTKHNMTVEMENMTEVIRKHKILIRKLRTEKEITERAYWRTQYENKTRI